MPALTASPLFGLTITLVAYALSLVLHQRFRFLHPLLVTSVLLIALLLLTRIPLVDYRAGGDILVLMLGPATVALAVPLYKHARAIRAFALPVAVSLFTGCIVGILSAAGLALLFHASRQVLLSVLSKSVTTPISMEVTRALGGSPELAATITVLSGLFGAVVAPPLLRLAGLRGALPMGLAMGLSSHGIGTASALRTSELRGTFAGLAMAFNGILTAALLTPFAPLVAGAIH